MSKYEIVLAVAGPSVRYLYEKPEQALRKIRTLQRKGIAFQIESGLGLPVTVEEIESTAEPIWRAAKAGSNA